MVLIAGGGLVVGGVSPASAGGNDHGEADETVGVVGDGDSVDVDRDSVEAGTVSFEVSSTNEMTAEGGGSEISLFTLKDGRSLDDFFAGLEEEFSATPEVAAKGTRDLLDAAVFRGLAEVAPDHPETVTESLPAGTYYLMDLGGFAGTGRPELTTLDMREDNDGDKDGSDDGDADGSDLRSDLTVRTEGDRFHAPDTWPHQGTYTFDNEDDTAHFMIMAPVEPGTTDEQVQAAFDNPDLTQAPDFALEGPIGGNDVVSPGYDLQLTYDLPPGTYVLLCFVADEETGIPHAFMGMHKVVVLE
jgi:hypothetical protein